MCPFSCLPIYNLLKVVKSEFKVIERIRNDKLCNGFLFVCLCWMYLYKKSDVCYIIKLVYK